MARLVEVVWDIVVIGQGGCRGCRARDNLKKYTAVAPGDTFRTLGGVYMSNACNV